MKRILIVCQHIEESPVSFPLAPFRLKAVLDKTGLYETEISEFTLADKTETMVSAIEKSKADAVGFSQYLWNTESLCAVAGQLKKTHPNLPLFAGGPEATARGEELKALNIFHFIVRGEGEGVLSGELERLFNGEYSDESRLVTADPVEQLGNLPSPFLSEPVALSPYRGVLWELSRGCPYNCAFCFEGRGTKGVRRFPLDVLKSEVKQIAESGIDRLWVLDPTFNADEGTALELLEMFLETAPGIHYSMELRAEKINRRLADALSELNVSLQIGLQSADPEVLKNVNRSINTHKYLRGIHLLQERHIPFGLDLIYGLPGDTPDGFKASINWALALDPEKIDIFPLAVLPGTELAERAGHWQLHYKHNPPYTLDSSPDFSPEDLEEARQLTDRIDRFYNRGQAAAWFPLLMRNTALSPVEILQDFPATGEDVLEDQLQHIEKLFADTGENSTAFTDLVRWLDSFKRFLNGEEVPPVTLHYAPEELEELFTLSLTEFNRFYQNHEQSWKLGEEDGEIYWYL